MVILDKNKKALVVDDCEDMRKMIAALLKKNEYEVVLAENGIQALKILFQNSPFDLIITDLNMPKLLGTDLIRVILLAQIKFHQMILFTAENSEHRELKAFKEELKPTDPISIAFKGDQKWEFLTLLLK
jgi:CheY-like chemotaxis protein